MQVDVRDFLMRSGVRGRRVETAQRPRRLLVAALGVLALAGLGGCAKFKQHEENRYVYVTAKESFLNDRFAAVSNRTATVTNGEKLTVLERQRRALKVKTADGAVGWIKEFDVADQETADAFEALKTGHASDPVVAKAVALNDVYLHSEPGRKSPRFFRLAEGDPMSLLVRASVAKDAAAQAPAAAGQPVEPVFEDWWLVRDAKGDTGWIYSRLIDVSAPDSLLRYAEGQRIVGAYLLAKADDPDSGMIDNGQTVTQIPEYVTVLGPYKAGLPYDFDQIRVFTWNVKKHRYETAFREHNIEGYLPVKIGEMKDPYQKDALGAQVLPSFTYRVLAADAPTPAADGNGVFKPARVVTKTYRLEGSITKRVVAPGAAGDDEAHLVDEAKKDQKGKRKK
jgi:SH3-like domain-containing protein